MKIRTRIIGAALAVVVVANVAYTGYFIERERSDAQARLDAVIEETGQLLGSVTAGPLYDGNVEQLRSDLGSFFLNPDIARLQLVERPPGDIRVELAREAAGGLGRLIELRVPIRRGPDELGEVLIVWSTAGIEQRLLQSRKELIVLSAASVLGLALVILLVTGGLTRPIDRLTQAAQALADGRLDQEIESRGAEELEILGRSFVRMRDAIREKMAALEDNNRRLNAEMAQRRAAEQERDRLVSIMEATTDMVSMADPDTNLTYLNRAGRAMTGVGDTPLAQLRIPDMHPEWAAALILEQGVPAAIRDGAWTGETALRDRSGREFPVSQVILSHKDAQGRLLYLSTVIRDITERKAAEEALRESQALLREAQEVAHVGSWNLDLASGHAVWSDEEYRLLGYAPGAVAAGIENFMQAVHPEDRERVHSAMQRAMDPAAADGYHVEHRVTGPGGERIVEQRGRVSFDAGGRPVRIFGTTMDITERRRARQALERSEQRYRTLMESAPDAIYINQDGIFAYLNPAALRLFGAKDASELVGTPVLDRIHVRDHAAVTERMRTLTEERRAVPAMEETFIRMDGSMVEVEVTAAPYSDADETGMQVIVRDVTERKRADEAMRRSEERYAMAAQIGRTGVWEMWPEEGRMVFDSNLVRVVGYDEGDLSQDLADWVATVPEKARGGVAAALQAVVEGRSDEYTLEHPVRRKDGSTGWVYVKGRRVSAPGEKPLRLVGSSVDITERKQAEAALQRLNEELERRVEERTSELAASNAQLKRALDTLRLAQEELVRSEKLASLGALVAGVAHELGSPLGNALTVATTLADKTAEFAGQLQGGTLRRSVLESYVEQAEQAAALLTRSLQQAGTLISDFKQVAVDQTSAQRRRFDLGEVVGEVVTTLQPQFRKTPHRIEVAIGDGILMDSFPGPLGQVIVNLATNALVHAFAGVPAGVVRIEAAPPAHGTVALAVSDNGSGIAAEVLPRIFDPFFTTRLGQGGSGLGLHIVYSIVTRMLGGRITVSSAPGAGSRFVLALPLTAPASGPEGLWDSIAVRRSESPEAPK